MEERLNHHTLALGVEELMQQDPDLARIVSLCGQPPLWEREEGFITLIHIILEQQVSLASAKAALEKLKTAVKPLVPEGFLKLSDEELKAMGFSRQKTRYGRELAMAIIEGRLDLDGLENLDDQRARDELMKIKGIGPWSADIYLLMALGRPDIWPKGDLALETAYQRLKHLPQKPDPDEMKRISQCWKPLRAVAARLLWHFYLSGKG